MLEVGDLAGRVNASSTGFASDKKRTLMPRAYGNILHLAHHDFHLQVGVDLPVTEKSVTLPPIKSFLSVEAVRRSS